MKEVDAYKFDWGNIVVDSYNTITQNATIIFNFNFSNPDLLVNIFNYSVGYIFWAVRNLPQNSSFTIIYDIRGLNYAEKEANFFSEKLKRHFDDYLIKKLELNILFNS